ncbi:hypothetical protein [Symbiopectobacterium purcellii]|uniref:hypothetical protein n=1 Tax=Symbiopectobacterium purcellii TaxID=2871826 RepID=UPI003F86B5A0
MRGKNGVQPGAAGNGPGEANRERRGDIAKRHYFDNSQLCFFAAYQGIGCNHF